MKQTTILLGEVAAGAVILFFGIRILMAPVGESGIWKRAGVVAAQVQMQEVVSENGTRMEYMTGLPVPQVELTVPVYKIGEIIEFPACVRVKTEAEENWLPIQQASGVFTEVLDIANQEGVSFGAGVFCEESQSTDEITTPVRYVQKSGKLCFYQSGSYLFKIKISDAMGRYVIKEIMIPVEAG